MAPVGIDQAFNYLAQVGIPQMAAVVFPDSMRLTAPGSLGSDGAGGQITGPAEDAYVFIPCSYQPVTRREARDTLNAEMVSQQMYLVTFPTHDGGNRINVDPVLHRIRVSERGDEPAKTFRLISIRDISGVVFEAMCVKED